MVSTVKGKTIGDFELVKPLGDGNFGVGWLAIDMRSDKKICVKVFKEIDKETETSFR